jgi:divalent metal cation (Fe/Co/Zn/Cd) transporter
MTDLALSRSALVRRGLLLNWITISYNAIEAIISVTAGVVSGSVALVSFGVDSAIEVTSSWAAHWRLRADAEPEHRLRVERLTHRIIGGSFLALAVYVTVESATTIWQREAPDVSPVGLSILALSVVIMPIIARASRRVARALGSHALEADAAQTSLCAYLSVIALAGVGLNAALGWWWADPVAALLMVPIIAKEGIEGTGGHSPCTDHCQAENLEIPSTED